MRKRDEMMGGLTQEAAEAAAVEALAFLASDPAELQRFLALSGLEVGELRAAATSPAFFAGLLDFILGSERTLQALCDATALSPERVVAARAALSRSYGVSAS